MRGMRKIVPKYDLPWHHLRIPLCASHSDRLSFTAISAALCRRNTRKVAAVNPFHAVATFADRTLFPLQIRGLQDRRMGEASWWRGFAERTGHRDRESRRSADHLFSSSSSSVVRCERRIAVGHSIRDREMKLGEVTSIVENLGGERSTRAIWHLRFLESGS